MVEKWFTFNPTLKCRKCGNLGAGQKTNKGPGGTVPYVCKSCGNYGLVLCGGGGRLLEGYTDQFSREEQLQDKVLIDESELDELKRDAEKWRNVSSVTRFKTPYELFKACDGWRDKARRLGSVEARARKELEQYGREEETWHDPKNKMKVKLICRVMGWPEPEWVKK